MDSRSTPGGKPAGSDAGSDSGYLATSTLEHLEGKVTGLFRMLKAEVESLKEMAKRTQVKGLKESVDQVCSIIGSIENNNVELKVARSQQAGNKLVVVDAKKVVAILTQTLNTTVESSNKAVLEAIASVSEKVTGAYEDGDSVRPGSTNSAEVKTAVANLQMMLEAQSAKMEEMAELGKQTSWTDVVRKNTKRGKGEKPVDKPAELAVAETRRTNQKNPPMKRKPPALLVRVEEGDYKNVLQKVRNSDEIKAVADKITALTKTKNGDLLVRVNPGQEGMAPLTEALGAAVGGNELVKELIQYQKVVIQDLDELASEAEVLEAIATVTEGAAGEAKVVTTIAANRGQKWMVVSLPTKAASIAHASGKLRVGYVNCRVRLWEERGRGRCPRCLVAGHASEDCKGPNRRDCCRACGATGHFEAGCVASDKDKATFRAQLTVERSPTAGNPSQQ